MTEKWRAERDVIGQAAELLRNQGIAAALVKAKERLENLNQLNEPPAYKVYVRILSELIVETSKKFGEEGATKLILGREAALPTLELH